MAALATSYFESGRGFQAQAAERNAGLLALQPKRRRGARTPEFFFAKSYDNSRLVKAADPVRARQMRVFAIAMSMLLALMMIYGAQHVSAIENGYRVEAEKQALDQLREENRQLKLAEAQLTQPDRISSKALELGLAEPQPGQVIHPNAAAESSAPVLAQVHAPASSF